MILIWLVVTVVIAAVVASVTLVMRSLVLPHESLGLSTYYSAFYVGSAVVVFGLSTSLPGPDWAYAIGAGLGSVGVSGVASRTEYLTEIEERIAATANTHHFVGRWIVPAVSRALTPGFVYSFARRKLRDADLTDTSKAWARERLTAINRDKGLDDTRKIELMIELIVFDADGIQFALELRREARLRLKQDRRRNQRKLGKGRRGS